MNTSLFDGRRYQVFLSSTFRDLEEERQRTIHTLLTLNSFPIAMEHFPASYEKQWEYIRPLIEESDFFICLIAGKYGSCDESGVSYTQREFQYALEKKVPIAVLYHENPELLPALHTEPTDEGKSKLANFLYLAKNDRLCKGWKNSDELQANLMLSILELHLKTDRPGWQRSAVTPKGLLEIRLANSVLQNKVTTLEARGHNAPIASFLDYDETGPAITKTLDSVADSCERATEKLKVRLMGICLHKSFPVLKKFIEKRLRQIRIEIRLAILEEDSEVYQTLNNRWRTLYDMFKQDLDALVHQLKTKLLPGDVSIKLTKYTHMPNWHGVLINHEHLFLGHHMLFYEDGSYSVDHNPYDQYLKGYSPIHDRKIKQYVEWFDFCRNRDRTLKENQLLLDTRQLP